MDLIYSQYGAHEAGFKGHPLNLIEGIGYLVTGVKSDPACDNIIISVTRKKFQVIDRLPKFIKKA